MLLKVVFMLALVACASAQFVFPNVFGGNYVQVAVNDEGVLVAANYAVSFMSRMWMGIYHHRLAAIVGAWNQVATNFVNYKLDVIVGLTTCLKSNVAFDLIGQCAYQEGWATFKRCSMVLGRAANGNFNGISSWACVTVPRNDIANLLP